ncbi:MotA/TolQ/ExbB proton channel family protein [Tuwongella immobilis]|uniref:Proton channel family protein:: MotA_ExbB n=1 Tax=Tuwongella immobilis TaxID=692036 RepID=A0A6C2YM13_9BACT|nr:MotA/TolQ/ExbB proton channel family protein [Tuwongella immobilis]VIP02404.1 proton channel family protein : : MotA_ExbB [Tuwongella immobilis]VTS01298.1 proton channel family protein : : MotA_ExbB [Tuwongella immobilis]
MRRLLIQLVLPLAFCLVPVMAAVLIAAVIPAEAKSDYLRRVWTSPIDWLILGLGFGMFVTQMLLSWQAFQWRGRSFDERPDRWLSYLAQAAEWFPLLGLIGTVAAILQTFSSINSTVTPQEIIRKYAPAITATGSGLYMALINILPTWVVMVGRELIQTLAGRNDASNGDASSGLPGGGA